MKKLVGMLSLLAITAMAACGGSTDESNQQARGTGRSIYGDCPGDDTGESCPGEDAYEACIVSKCDAQFKECLGPGYQSGSYGGACASEIACVMKCNCGDTACELDCYRSASQECKACGAKMDSCISSSGCKEPECGSGSGGSGGGNGQGGSGGSHAGGTGGSQNVCPYTTDSFSCSAACANLKQIAAKCKDAPGLSANIKRALAAAADGNGAKCRAACATDSPNFMNQWKCFQGTPVSADCTAIAGCTIGNCP